MAQPAVRCSACLDDRKCWVCLGSGRLKTRHGASLGCHRCYGSGKCPRCQVPADRVEQPTASAARRLDWLRRGLREQSQWRTVST